MSHQRDYEGKEYIMTLFDVENNPIDEHYIDGDPLQDPRVDKSTHTNGGYCTKCNYRTFIINSGKEYCGLCNEFYDTYKYLRDSSEVAQKKERMSRQILKEIEKAIRECDFVKVKEMEQALIWSQMDDYTKAYSATQEMQENIMRKQKKTQDAYFAKRLNHMNSNRAQYYDIP